MSMGGQIVDAVINNPDLYQSRTAVANNGPSFGAKGGAGPQQTGYTPEMQPMPFYASAPSATMDMTSNAGRIVDPTLLLQQSILQQQRPSYAPLMTPENYLDFYLKNAPEASEYAGLMVPKFERYVPPAPAPASGIMNAVMGSGGKGGGGGYDSGFGGFGGDSFGPDGGGSASGNSGSGPAGSVGADGSPGSGTAGANGTGGW